MSEIFIPIGQPWPQPQSQIHLEAKMKIYTTSCSALTKTTLSAPLIYHHRFYSSIFFKFWQVKGIKLENMNLEKNIFQKKIIFTLFIPTQ